MENSDPASFTAGALLLTFTDPATGVAQQFTLRSQSL